MDAAKLKQLRLFIDQCKSNPALLDDPSLFFFRDYLESLGAKIPHSGSPKASSPYVVDESDDDMADFGDEEEEIEIVESDVEIEGEIVDPDNDPPQQMGDSSVEVTEENRDASQAEKSLAMEAISEGKFDEAVNHLTQAILLNPSAIMYATRASVYFKMEKPNAAIRDANAALEINPDSAKGYKFRGLARSMLGKWEDSAKDLHVASRLDYDEEISAVLKKVEPNVHRIEEHKKKYERLRKEKNDNKLERERQRRRADAQAAYDRAKKQEQNKASPPPCPGKNSCPEFASEMPSGFPGFPPGNMDFGKILNNPELMTALQDPEVMSALQDVMKNPANLAKHQSNPKVAPIIAQMMNKFGQS